MPRGDMISSSTRIVSVIQPPHHEAIKPIEKRRQSTPGDPKLYILTSISQVNRAKKDFVSNIWKHKNTCPWDLSVGASLTPGTPPPLPPAAARRAPSSQPSFCSCLSTEMWQEHPWFTCLPGSSPASATTQTCTP